MGFVDPDDVLDRRYLEAVTRFLDTGPDCAMLATRMVYLDDATGRLRDEHPLRYRFEGGSRVIDLEVMPHFFHTPVSCAFFPTSTVRELDLHFDTRIRPHFEDTHFTARFLLHAGSRIGFVADARYLYRQRADSSSLSQGKHLDPRAFTTVPRFGYLPCLSEATAVAGHVPRWLQDMILYSMTWQFASAERLEPSAAVGEVGAGYVRAIREVRTHLDDDVIEAFPVPQLSRVARDVLLRLNDDADWHARDAVIDRRDRDAGLDRLVYLFKGRRPTESITVGDEPVDIAHGKTQSLRWFGEHLLTRRIAWFPAGERIRVVLDGDGVALHDATAAPTAASLRSAVRSGAVASAQRMVGLASRAPHHFADAWLLMDRVHGARDNAEHLFRHLRLHRPDINAWFVLDRGSPDWDRLERDGFGDRLVAHGSAAWIALLLTCAHLVSSRPDATTPRRITRWRAEPVRFTHLGRAIMTDDESLRLNAAPIDLHITSSPREADAITADGSPYLLTWKEVRLTGMPRLDRLRRLGDAVSPTDRDLLLVAPAWQGSRSSAPGTRSGGQATGVGEWESLVRSPGLADVANRHDLRIACLAPPGWTPDMVDACLTGSLVTRDDDVQRVAARTAVVITDDPSLALEFGYIERPVVHVRLARTVPEGGARPGQPGWFACERDGLGPLAESPDDVIAAVSAASERGFTMEAPHLQRVQSIFPVRDAGCCARVTTAIAATRPAS